MVVTTEHARVLKIPVGPLTGTASLRVSISESLQEFNDLFLQGIVPQIEWDLTQVDPGGMSMSGLTCFLAVAARMRKYAKTTPTARVQFKPKAFAFWDDVRLLQIVEELDLFRWVPDDIIGGYGAYAERTSVNTRLLSFPEAQDVPDWADTPTWIKWKDRQREVLTTDFMQRIGPLVDKKGEWRHSENVLVEQLSLTSAELVLNANAWGRSRPFVGLQRSSAGTTVSVCDAGRGLRMTLYEQAESKGYPKPNNHQEAILLASFANSREFGLRGAIGEVVSRGGWVSISSYDAEVVWGQELWRRAVQVIGEDIRSAGALAPLISRIKPAHPQRAHLSRGHGYMREFPGGLRGVRISFELKR